MSRTQNKEVETIEEVDPPDNTTSPFTMTVCWQTRVKSSIEDMVDHS